MSSKPIAVRLKKAEKTAEAPSSEMRRHYFHDDFVIIAPKRNLRPDNFATANPTHKLETAESPHIERDPSHFEVTDSRGKWLIKVIGNAFPALSTDNPKAYGAQEIVIETPRHNQEFSELPVSHIEKIIETYQNRITQLKKIPGIRYVQVFKNDGPKAGASIAHAHSQIVALPIEPPAIRREAEAMQAYAETHGACAYCDVLDWERRQKVRIIYEDKAVTAITPYASAYGFEVWILPKRHIGTLSSLRPSERVSFATILKKVAAKLDSTHLSFNFFVAESLAHYDHHLVIKIEPRQSTWAGFELSSGIIINQISPEFAASWYRGK
jgi:UDPglucose--hexose-1-phosphate uridylyltransferase